MTIEKLICIGSVAAAGYLLVRWCHRRETLTPDPWGAELDKIARAPETPELCPHCLRPQSPNAWFCPDCGQAVGPYNNCMPYLNAFSEGEVLRNGVSNHVRPSFFLISGYLLYTLGTYYIFAPLYWYRFFRNLKAARPEAEPTAGLRG